ncbi:hypothetical protein GGP89_001161 [Salinibacter ruber]|uniref:Uncharacterized protein n=1 Tax=Salinibacter ruber TaxID=146919 RepID=A0A9X2U126_9BACT|nr:hypothetical protein [Salinibacter ruber]MCS3857787.1 hypothetical protein [Salinibacter ruber]MCS3864613.1 hypothetical protein [Salinibacter ruber]
MPEPTIFVQCRSQTQEEPKAFGGGNELKQKNKIAKLERMVGKKKVEVTLLENFSGES